MMGDFPAPLPAKRALRERIDRLPASADAKAIISDLLDVALEVGGRMIAVGHQIVAFVFDLARRCPHTTFGVLVALAVSSLIASVPLLGLILGPLLSPILLAFGLAAGAVADFRDAPLRARIAHLEQYFVRATSDARP